VVPFQQVGQEPLVNRTPASLQLSQLSLIVVHQSYVVAQLGEASARYQPNIARPHNRNSHPDEGPRVEHHPGLAFLDKRFNKPKMLEEQLRMS
jgi:hypothetical protein